MASDSGSIAVMLALTLCGCMAERPPSPPIRYIQPMVLPRQAHHRPDRVPVKQQLREMQGRIDALEGYLQNNDLARWQHAEGEP